ncbi:MAG: PmoA family protein [Bryobacteraceae bacterium]|nr:PmoA family protein [Bryobacteraceae bacterium]
MNRIPILLLLALPLLAEVRLERKPDRIDVNIDGAPFTTFYFGADAAKPYLHPLRTADGTIVTRRWPMETVEGESHDHPHHTGLWFSHDDVNGVAFWANNKPGPKIGKIVLDKIVKVESGQKMGVIEGDFHWNDAAGKTILNEHRTMTFYADPKNRTVDIDIQLSPESVPVKFGDTKEGTFAIRLSDKLTEKGKGGLMTNAEGKSGMKAVWGKPSPWVDYAGTVDDKPLGIAILDHPQNPKHPSYWHSRDYGLFAANPFGERDYFSDKSRDGSLTIEPGKSLRFRYRVIVHPGLTADSDIAKLYQSYK